MGNAKHIGRVGAPTAALGVGNVRAVATRLTVSIGAAAVVVMATAAPVPVSPVSPAVKLSADSTALIMGTSGVPTPDDFYLESVKNRFIAPTHPGHIEYVKVTTPEEIWPVGLVNRFASLLGIELGDQEIFGLDDTVWDVPGWGLFDRTLDQSVRAGVTDLEAAIAENGNDHLVIYGYSQSALIANREKCKLAEQYPVGTEAPDIDFVLGGDPNQPNGGLFARFPGLYIPILDWSLNGPAPTDTQFDTVEVNRQYDFMGDFPLYPLNLVATANAVLGFLYVHLYPFDVSLAPDASTSLAFQGTHGDTSYYFFETQDLPLFGPLRTLGVPEPLIDVVEPFFRVLVDLGYDRSIPPWEPTPARLIPTTLDPAKVATDLVNAIGEGINNAAALIGSPAPLSTRAAGPAATAGPADAAPAASEAGKSDASPQVTPADTRTETEQVTSTEPATGNEQMSTNTATSTKDVPETAKADETSTEPTPASAPELSASARAPMSESAKPSARPATPRPVVRSSLGIGEQLRDLPHRGNGGHPTTRTAAAGDSSDGHSSGGDAGDS